MKRYKNLVRNLLRNAVYAYRKKSEHTQEDMAEKLRESPRSYVAQEHGKYGFSATTLLFFLSILPAEEAIILIQEFKDLIKEEDEHVHVA